uniref:THO complex subunit 2 n=1 Tax=Timema tahoe TaxID=61484 RepID=A0A7R9FFA6_9NEOP|nr:unnamed protein product [Timema tahoe]
MPKHLAQKETLKNVPDFVSLSKKRRSYKQRKFNLFREESEGYAKLIAELNQEISGNVTAKNVLEIIKSLIGCFNLDPNRVLDVILESFECRPDQHQFFIPLLRSYMSDPKILCEVLGFKYCFYQTSTEEVTPKSLYLVTALMLQHSIIALDDIYCWYGLNQKFGLCEALLKVGDWTHAEQLTKKLPDHCMLEQHPVAWALCQLLHAVIEPVYRKHCLLAPQLLGDPVPPPGGSLAPKCANTFQELKEHAIPMMVALGTSMHYDPVLMYKVLRLTHAALTQNCSESQTPTPTDNNLYYEIITVMDDVILPSLSFMESNCCIAEQVWNILQLYPYNHRYCLYSRWKNDTYQNNAKLLRKRGDALKKMKSLMKRVSKENIKPVGRSIGKLTHASPGFLFDYMLIQIQMYDNLINPVVDSLKYLTSLSYDVLGYCLVESLASADRDRFKHDGTSISLWLQSLASFCGAIFKKYNIELTGLLQYVANQLKAQKRASGLISIFTLEYACLSFYDNNTLLHTQAWLDMWELGMMHVSKRLEGSSRVLCCLHPPMDRSLSSGSNNGYSSTDSVIVDVEDLLVLFHGKCYFEVREWGGEFGCFIPAFCFLEMSTRSVLLMVNLKFVLKGVWSNLGGNDARDSSDTEGVVGLDLLILKEIVQKMAGIEAAEEMTSEQLEAMAGGDLLKGEAGYFSQVRNTKKASQRLKEILSEHDLTVALCLLMAQQRYCVVYKETDKSHLKLVGKLYDQCQDTLVQFGTFLGSTMSMEDYINKFPSIHSMLSEFHIHADVAFFLARPTFSHAINAKYEALRKADPNSKKMSLTAKHQKYCEAVKEIMDPIVLSVRPLHPLKVWEDISPQFLVSFWSLTMYDLFVPVESYQREVNKLKQLSLQVMDSKDTAVSKLKKEQERYTSLMEKLQEEKKKQQEHVEKVMVRLKQDTTYLEYKGGICGNFYSLLDDSGLFCNRGPLPRNHACVSFLIKQDPFCDFPKLG